VTGSWEPSREPAAPHDPAPARVNRGAVPVRTPHDSAPSSEPTAQHDPAPARANDRGAVTVSAPHDLAPSSEPPAPAPERENVRVPVYIRPTGRQSWDGQTTFFTSSPVPMPNRLDQPMRANTRELRGARTRDEATLNPTQNHQVSRSGQFLILNVVFNQIHTSVCACTVFATS